MLYDSENNENLSGGGDVAGKGLEERMLLAKLKVTFDAKVRTFNELCWDMCVEKPKSKLDQKTELCINNCVDRFIDASKFIMLRFAQNVQRNGAQL